MIVLAALAWGVCAAFAAAAASGLMPSFAFRKAAPRPEQSRAQLWLRQAGVALTPRQFWVGSAAVGLGAFMLLTFVTGVPVVALVPAGAVALLPRAYFSRSRSRRLREVQSSWPDGLRDLLASITAGLSLTQALTTLAVTGPEPLRDAFARFPLLSRMLGTIPALEIIKEELADATSDRVIEVLILAHERGGQIVKRILEDLVVATTRDLKVLDEIETEGLEMKINARAVLVLPWLVLVMLTLSGGSFRDFYRGPGGLVVVCLGAVGSGLGAWLIGRLGRNEGERRVFGSAVAIRSEGVR